MNKTLSIALLLSLSACVGESVATESNSSGLAVKTCVQFRERAFECRETVVDRWIDVRAKYHPDIKEAIDADRSKVRKVALQEFTADGSGPLAPRSEACRAVVERTPPQAKPIIDRMSACTSQKTCEGWSTCVLPAFEEMNRMMTQAR